MVAGQIADMEGFCMSFDTSVEEGSGVFLQPAKWGLFEVMLLPCYSSQRELVNYNLADWSLE